MLLLIILFVCKKIFKFSFTYSLGPANLTNFLHIILDLSTYSTKALALTYKERRSESKKFVFLPLSITFFGSFDIKRESIKQQNSAHYEMFFNTIKWLLKNQNSVGGWPVQVSRFADNRPTLKTGWTNAMSQGHALSLLTRAYHLTSDKQYVDVGRRALNIFSMNSSKGGVLNKLFGYDWYEEYPTTPGTFVLNGFLFSLIGLYDFSAVDNSSLPLFNRGIESLKIFLPLFDTGQGSNYDLKHVGLKTSPNVANWDYHTLHIYLLKLMFSITGEHFFDDVAERWITYTFGKRAKHN